MFALLSMDSRHKGKESHRENGWNISEPKWHKVSKEDVLETCKKYFWQTSFGSYY